MINIHHFGEQIIDFLKANNDFGLTLHISDERDLLLDTGGGIRKARRFFENSDEPFLVHNVDILSDMNLKELYDFHLRNGSVATLLASRRKTSRYLLFDVERRLRGWINKDTGQVRPEGFLYDESLYREYAFSGIHVFFACCLPVDGSAVLGRQVLYYGLLSGYLRANGLLRLSYGKAGTD